MTSSRFLASVVPKQSALFLRAHEREVMRRREQDGVESIRKKRGIKSKVESWPGFAQCAQGICPEIFY
jgi:hypothetical protein